MSAVSATTIDGRPTEISPKALENLASLLRGPLLMPDTAAYGESRALWNAMIARRPLAIARCLGTPDIVAAVRFAKEHDLPISIKGGGHNIAGLGMCDGGLALDLSLMRGVWVDPAARVARAQAGCLLGDVDRETQLHGLAAVLGFVSNTGIAGLTLGGGFGYLTRRFGWTSDHVLGMDLVTAGGEWVRATADENPDLFWGLCGGGGNFGVVTGFEYRLHPVGPEVVGGVIAWPGSEATKVMELFRETAKSAPPEHIAVLIFRKAPPAPWLPKEIHGEPIVALAVLDTGPLDEAETRAARLKGFGRPAGDIVQRRSYVSQQAILDATQPPGRRYYWKSEYLPGFDPELLSASAEHAWRMASPLSAVIVFPLDGELDPSEESRSAMGNRDARAVLNIAAAWESPEDDAANIGWAREAWEDLRRFSTGGAYVNFQTEDEGEDRTRAAYASSWDRLVEIKSKWDPRNRFRVNKNIPPRPDAAADGKARRARRGKMNPTG